MCVCLILIMKIFFNNFFCVNCDVCECVHVLYTHDITLYNLILRKYKGFAMIRHTLATIIYGHR